MSKRPDPEELNQLLQFCKEDSQLALITQLQTGDTLNQAAEKLGRQKRSVVRTLKRIRQEASRHNYVHGNPVMDIPTDMPLSGRSVYVKYPEPLDNGVKAQWIKTKAVTENHLQALKGAIDAASVPAVKLPKFRPGSRVRDDVAPVIVIADMHLGMLACAMESGEEWNLQIAMDAIKRAIDEHVEDMGFHEFGLLANTGDLVHYNATMPKTSQSGNVLDGSTWASMGNAAEELLIYAIEAMLKRCKFVRVMNVRGNHDESASWWVNKLIALRYRGNDRVEVMDNTAKLLGSTWGRNLILGHHGDGRGINAQAIHNKATDTFRKEWGETSFTLGILGHVHAQRVTPISANTHYEVFDSIIAQDAYHAANLYGGNRLLHMLFLKKSGGIRGRLAADPMDHNPRLLLAA